MATSPRLFSTSTARSVSEHGIKTCGVIGAGQMGLGIAYVAAMTAKVNVLIMDRDETALQKGLMFMDKLIEKDVKKGKFTAEQGQEGRARVKTVSSLEAFKSADLIIEAASESLAIKQRIFADLAKYASPEAILATNTSSISISKIAASAVVDPALGAAGCPSPSRVLGVHFMNPVPIMKLVELIPALQTSPKVLERARLFAVSMGKETTISKDTPGFIANRVLMPFINEAIVTLETGVASAEDIDKTCRLGLAHPMGPLTLADFIGLDTCLAIMETLQRETGDSKYRPAVLLSRMVDAGWLGKKSGRGFYTYNP